MSSGMPGSNGHTDTTGQPLAAVAGPDLRVAFRAALPLTLHDATCWRTDGNSPVRITSDGAVAFFSTYTPIGHTLRRRGRRDLVFDEPAVPITLRNDPDPTIGKWIEAIWQEPGGPLHGWYHAEEPAPCSGGLFVPHIGRAMSRDGGSTWDCCGEVLRLPPSLVDCSWKNGFFCGGYGDLSLVVDRSGGMLYLFFTSYHTDESLQGVAVLRQRAGDSRAPIERWTGRQWSGDPSAPLRPILPVRRGWRHADPEGFWGPALHYNRALDAHVMLLNHTSGGDGDLVQAGIYASVNPSLADPLGWSVPLRIVQGGAWYPQVIGLEEGCGDHEAGAMARFFMAGFSAWEIGFSPEQASEPADRNRPLACTKRDFERLFGPGRRCPW